MFVMDNFSINAREVSKISSDFVDVYVHEIGRGIILMDDLLCFKKKKSAEHKRLRINLSLLLV